MRCSGANLAPEHFESGTGNVKRSGLDVQDRSSKGREKERIGGFLALCIALLLFDLHPVQLDRVACLHSRLTEVTRSPP